MGTVVLFVQKIRLNPVLNSHIILATVHKIGPLLNKRIFFKDWEYIISCMSTWYVE
jgi:hypothetical protein